MTTKKRTPELIRGTVTNRRTEGDYMSVLLDTVTLDDWRDVVQGALQEPVRNEAPLMRIQLSLKKIEQQSRHRRQRNCPTIRHVKQTTRLNTNIKLELHTALKARAVMDHTDIGALIEVWIASWAGK